MANDNIPNRNDSRRWTSFSRGAKSHIARRFWQYRPEFRTRVIEAALQHWPNELARSQHAALVHRIFHDPEFRQAVRLGPITWWLLGLAVKAMLSALIDYWFLTEEPSQRRRQQPHQGART